MGGKSRKSGGVSRKLIQQIQAGCRNSKKVNPRIKRFFIDEEDEKSFNKKIFGEDSDDEG